MAIAYFQPITRGELSSFFGKEASRDLIADHKANGKYRKKLQDKIAPEHDAQRPAALPE